MKVGTCTPQPHYNMVVGVKNINLVRPKKKGIDSRVLIYLFQLPLICLFSDLNKKREPHLLYSDVKIEISKLINVVSIDLNKS